RSNRTNWTSSRCWQPTSMARRCTAARNRPIRPASTAPGADQQDHAHACQHAAPGEPDPGHRRRVEYPALEGAHPELQQPERGNRAEPEPEGAAAEQAAQDSTPATRPRSELLSASVITTSTNRPTSRGCPAKFTDRMFSVLPVSSFGSLRDGPSTSTFCTLPTIAPE